MLDQELLGACSVFQGLGDATLRNIWSLAQVITVKEDERIFEKGQDATHLYVVGTGSVNLCQPISVMMSEREILVEVKGRGDLIGWSALVPPHKLTLSAYAATDCALLQIPGRELRALCEQDPQLGFAIMSNLASMIWTRLMQVQHMLAKEIEFHLPAV